MKNSRVIIGIFMLLGICSCADMNLLTDPDHCKDGEYQNCDGEIEAGDCHEQGGCKHPVSLATDTYLGVFDGNKAIDGVSFAGGYVGRIDSGCRSLSRELVGGDIDWIAVKAEPGTPLAVHVNRFVSSKTLPILYLRNRAGGELVYSKPTAYGYASLSFLAPDELFYISVEEKANYDFDYQTKCSDSDVVGGKDYYYTVFIEKSDLKIRDVGLISTSATQTGRFSQAGQAIYYRVAVPVDKRLKLTVTSASGNKYKAHPVISPISSKTPYEGGTDYSWVYAGSRLKTNSLFENNLIVHREEIPNDYALCGETECHYTFVVTDFESEETDYEYKLSIEAI